MSRINLGRVMLLTGEDAMEVVDIVENEDGSARLSVDLTSEDVGILIEYSMQELLIKAAKRLVEERATDAGL